MTLAGLATWWSMRKQARNSRDPFDSPAVEEYYELLDQASMVTQPG